MAGGPLASLRVWLQNSGLGTRIWINARGPLKGDYLGLHWETGKENGSNYLGLRV